MSLRGRLGTVRTKPTPKDQGVAGVAHGFGVRDQRFHNSNAALQLLALLCSHPEPTAAKPGVASGHGGRAAVVEVRVLRNDLGVTRFTGGCSLALGKYLAPSQRPNSNTHTHTHSAGTGGERVHATPPNGSRVGI